MRDALVIGTAGHIDHGKTALVRALTGADLDQLPEERERGITIALGFASLDLPDGRVAAFVDVPGHERLVRTMVAGATGMDAVLLCVSAVDGVMPQTREHLAILELLGVRQGAVALTLADLVDDELLELAVDDVTQAVAGTFLEDRPIVPFSAVDGRGRDALIAVIAGFEDSRRPPTGPFRLPVDRAFVLPGFGTVVTGTAWSGQVEDGAAVRLLPSGQEARIRGMQVHGRKVSRVTAGSRAALNLAGVDRDRVPRGTLVVTGEVPSPRMIDVLVQHLESADPLPDGAPVRVLLGTAEVLGNLHLAEDRDELLPGTSVPAQLRLAEPLPCLPGDRFIFRRTSPLETLGGGEVVDPWAPRMRRRHRVATGEQIRRLRAGQAVVLLERAGESGLAAGEWAARRALYGAEDVGEALGDRIFAPRVVARLEGALLEALTAYHADNPLSLGAQRRELRRGRLGHLPDRVFDALVERLADLEQLQIHGPILRIAGFEIALTPGQAALRAAIEQTLRSAGLQGRTPRELHEAHPEPEVAALLRLLERDGRAVQLQGLGWIAGDALRDLEERVRAWFTDHDALTPGDFKELTDTTRKAAIPLLEWLDRNRLTRRQGDARLPGPALTDEG